MDKRIEKIINDIRAFHSDTSLPVEKTKEGLEEIWSEVESMLQCLK